MNNDNQNKNESNSGNHFKRQYAKPAGVPGREVPVAQTTQQQGQGQQQQQQQQQQQTNGTAPQKSKLAAGLFGIFLGCFGVHNFYLGFYGKAVAQLLLTLLGWCLCGLGPIAASIWGLIEGILILTDTVTTDANGTPLRN